MADPYGFITKDCKISATQELKLRKCPFARESEQFPELTDSLESSSPTPTPTPPGLAGILMASLPDGSASAENEEEFQTPPEQGYSSSQPYLSGSEDLKTLAAVAAAIGSQSDDEDDAEERIIVDLETEFDDLGFSEAPDKKVRVSEDLGVESEKFNLGEIGGKARVSEDLGVESEKFNLGEIGGKARVSEDLGVESETLYVGETELAETENKGDESVSADFMDIECVVATVENLESPVKALVVYTGPICEVGSPMQGINDEELGGSNEEVKCNGVVDGEEKDGVTRAEEKHKDVANGKEKSDGVGRHESALSMKVGEGSVGREGEAGNAGSKNGSSFLEIMEVLKVLLAKNGDGCTGTDGPKKRKKRTWDYPKPRWWPPEGYD